jgi:diguanylate cyclase (GGDEF)-like protein
MIAYPVCAGVVIAASLGALGLVGLGKGYAFVLWTVGILVFGVGDIVYAYRLAFDQYVSGTWLDALWAVGVVMFTSGAVRLRSTGRRTVPGARSLIVVAVAAVASVVVLTAAPDWSQAPLPSVLALVTLSVCAVRLMLVFLQLRELAAIREQAMTDELTGAANRRALYAALDRRFAAQDEDRSPVEQADEPLGHGFALALIDLDHFKEVNDSFGHAAGDDLLREVVTRFSRALDQLQTPHLFARLGGDEFAVLLHEVGSREAALVCGTALDESLGEPIVLDEVVLHVRASIGIALAPEHADNRGDMLFAADAAMYAAKTSAEPVAFYSPSAVGDRRKRLEVAEDLYSALERGELTVEYQPILTPEGDLVGAEALVRWDHPERGRLSPAEFLDVAERYRLTPSIAARVLDVALADLRRWRASGTIMRLSVNVSASDLRDESLVDIVASALLKHGVPPSVLTIEITETAMMRDPGMAQSVMRALDELGVQLAVDDYGTGYSSLEYLLKLPINEIKLDRAFSAHLVDEIRSVAIVRSTVDLTHALGLRMVAEGVENEHTLAILHDLGCDLVQGWHLGRPMPAAGFEEVLAARSTTGPSVDLAS